MIEVVVACVGAWVCRGLLAIHRRRGQAPRRDAFSSGPVPSGSEPVPFFLLGWFRVIIWFLDHAETEGLAAPTPDLGVTSLMFRFQVESDGSLKDWFERWELVACQHFSRLAEHAGHVDRGTTTRTTSSFFGGLTFDWMVEIVIDLTYTNGHGDNGAEGHVEAFGNRAATVSSVFQKPLDLINGGRWNHGWSCRLSGFRGWEFGCAHEKRARRWNRISSGGPFRYATGRRDAAMSGSSDTQSSSVILHDSYTHVQYFFEHPLLGGRSGAKSRFLGGFCSNGTCFGRGRNRNFLEK